MSSFSADLVATGIPSTMLGDVWPDLWPLLEPAARLLREPVCLLPGIRAKDLQLWAVYEQNRAVAGIVTRLWTDTTSGERIGQIHLVGGSRLLEWANDFLDKLTAWAKAEGCVWLEAAGRPGWKRIAPKLGFVPAFTSGPDLYWRRAV